MSIFNFSIVESETKNLPAVEAVSDEHIDNHEADMQLDLTEINNMVAEMDSVHGRFELALDTFNYLEGHKHEGPDAMRNAKALLAAALNGVEAQENIAAIESDANGSIANEVFKSARENIKKFIDWIVKRFQAMTKQVKAFFLKYMGTIERIQKDATKKGEKLSEMGTYTLKEKGDKVDISGYATTLMREDKVIKGSSDITTGVQQLGTIIGAYSKNLLNAKVSKAVKTLAADVKKMKGEEFDGSVTPSMTAVAGEIEDALTKLEREAGIKATVTGDKRFGRQIVKSVAKGLLGNSNIFVARAQDNVEEGAKLNLAAVRFMHYQDTKAKTKVTKAELPTAAVSELTAIVEACQENLAALYDLVRGGEREAYLADVEGLYEAVKGIEKAVGGDNYTMQVRSSISKIESCANRLSEIGQTVVLSIAAQDRAVVSAALRYVGSAMSNYEAPKAE